VNVVTTQVPFEKESFCYIKHPLIPRKLLNARENNADYTILQVMNLEIFRLVMYLF
jgi:hypothetical protein